MVLGQLLDSISAIHILTFVLSLLGSLIVSLLASIGSIKYQLNQERKIRESQELENWYSRTIALLNQIHRELSRLPHAKEVPNDVTYTGFKELERADTLVNKLTIHQTEAPPEVDSEVLESIESLNIEFYNPQSDSDPITTTDIKRSILPIVESIMDGAVRESERYTKAPYSND